ncbi:hypothetical protein ACHAXA_011146 [Cyclostephanos tholiformis]|uniref:Phospholipid/glycerol acyltransferase domain-containing protein n=1 Tax=Cyclostephanos tholiformis TaxID=382380 RepID=A0ABD3SEY7_9STRA
MRRYPRRLPNADGRDGGQVYDGVSARPPAPPLSADDGSGLISAPMRPLKSTTMIIIAVVLLFSLSLLFPPPPSSSLSPVVDAAASETASFRSTFRGSMTRRRRSTVVTALRASSLRTPPPGSSSSESTATPAVEKKNSMDADAHSPSLSHHEHHHHHHHHQSHHLLRHHHHAIAWPKTSSSSSSSSEFLESTPSHPAMISVEIDTKKLHHNGHHHDLRLVRHHHDTHHLDHPAVVSDGTTNLPMTTTASTTTSEPASPPPSHVLTIDEIKPIFKFKSKRTGKTKVLNLHGLRHLLVVVLTMPMWMIGLEIMHALGDAFPGFDDDRGKFDGIGKMWCRAYLGMTDCYPKIDGDVGRLLGRERDGGIGIGHAGPCLFVANHASFLDIAVLCCVLNPTFKFIAKDSLEKFPGVGRQLVGGEHLLINRDDKRSQLRTFKRAMKYLEDGVSIMAFPEGARSPDGRLMEFKGGMFSLAMKTGVPIVPLSLSNTHAVYPGVGFLPVQDGRDRLRVYVHDPISVSGKDEAEIADEVRRALLSELPMDQHPLAAGDVTTSG